MTSAEYCLTCLTNQGDIQHLQPARGISTLTFTKSGQGFYQKSPSEFQRFTLSSHNAVEGSAPSHRRARTPNRMLLRAPTAPPPAYPARPEPRLPAKSLKELPRVCISVNQHDLHAKRHDRRVGSPLARHLNLNEFLRSEAVSVDISVDSVRIFSDNESQQRNWRLRSADRILDQSDCRSRGRFCKISVLI
ncbi:hypothetical protein BV898_00655 [Hypsibius exemplaris]|uniref:Uncharacterized protein n=1 Tax=Hypsibius exemplaris TaxID=2072580 RepID=A0A1W0XE49_HYPEX|nr:hypothetical protein BV898_00655 [Hypsibius exemplaris]